MNPVLVSHVISTYDAIAAPYAETFSAPSDSLDAFLRLLPQGASIVDVGCGPGIEIAACHQKGFSVEGIDLSEKMVQQARQRNPGIKISKADLRSFSLSTKAQACLASCSLIHIPKKEIPTALENIRNNLKFDGFLYVSVHEGESGEILRTEPFDPSLKIFLNIFSEQEIVQNLEAAHFEILETRKRPAASAALPYAKRILFARRAAEKET